MVGLTTALELFIKSPSFAAFLVLLLAASIYGIIKVTAGVTRIAIAAEAINTTMESLETKFDRMADKVRIEHKETRVELSKITETVIVLRARVEQSELKIIQALGDDGEITRKEAADRRLVELREAVQERFASDRAAIEAEPAAGRRSRPAVR